jgi:hypothetical protein
MRSGARGPCGASASAREANLPIGLGLMRKDVQPRCGQLIWCEWLCSFQRQLSQVSPKRRDDWLKSEREHRGFGALAGAMLGKAVRDEGRPRQQPHAAAARAGAGGWWREEIVCVRVTNPRVWANADDVLSFFGRNLGRFGAYRTHATLNSSNLVGRSGHTGGCIVTASQARSRSGSAESPPPVRLCRRGTPANAFRVAA